MSDNSLIEWCTATWNFLIGCTKKSAGCMGCYAIRQAWRMMHNPNPKIAKKFEGTVAIDSKGELNWTGRINFDDDTLLKPLGWRLPRRVFVNSLSDLFHKNVKDEWIDQAFAVMALCPQHTFQILTKEPERMRDYLSRSTFADHVYEAARQLASIDQLVALARLLHGPIPATSLPNVWLGTSCEDQARADERIPLLIETPAAVRWISAEPLLGPIDLQVPWSTLNAEYPKIGIHWVVCGGESGPKARPMHPDWARSLRDQCVAAGVPFFFKQWGEWSPEVGCDGSACNYLSYGWPDDSRTVHRVGKKAAGRLLDGREWSEYPKAKAAAAV